MDAVNDPTVTDIVVMKSAQVGWTEVLGNVVGYFISQDPSPMLLIQPTLDMAQTWSKDRLAPMLRDTPALRGTVSDPKSKDSNNTILHKTFAGGHLSIAGANSAAGLASRPIRVLLCDEVDRYPPSAGSEGDPVNLARKRTTTFWNRKRLMGSTPTVKGTSRIEAAFESSDQRRYYVPCPHCDEMQPLKWAHVKWPDSHPEQAYYACEKCGAVITDADKPAMLAAGEWRSSMPFNGTAGFHLNELYSPWVSFGDMASMFVEAKKLPETLQTWVNTALGETWEDRGEQIDESGLLERRENYGPAVPIDAVVLTAGVDIQDDRLEIEVVGWGAGYESWSAEYNVLHGDPAKPDIWQKLDDYLLTQFDHESGAKMRIVSACVDTGGHHTQAAYRFCKARYSRHVYAIKGMAGTGRPLVRAPDRKSRASVRLFQIGVDTAKEMLYSRLKIAEKGPGYCHFPAHYDADYFTKLTAEKVMTKYTRGFATRVWVKKTTSIRNEALDCRVYAMAALELSGVNIERAGARLAQRAERAKHEHAPAAIAEPTIQTARRPLRQQRKNWVTGW